MHKLMMVGLVVASLFAVTGCGDSPEDKELEKAMEELDKAGKELKEAAKNLESDMGKLKDAASSLSL